MARKSVVNGLMLLACSVSLSAPAIAADDAPAAAAAATPTASATTTTTSSTTSTAPATSTTASTAPAAATATPAATTTTTNSSSSSTSTTSTPADGAATTSSSSSKESSTTTTTPTSTTTTSTTEKKKEESVNYAQTYQNAFRSECILIAEYVGYDKSSPDVRWNQPVKAEYQIIRVLKGPPLNHRLPLKFEFHDRTNPPTPAGWKFGPDKMPEKGSKWLIFIEHAVPHNGQFETYEGSWGRQPLTEENQNKVYQLLNAAGEAGY